MTRATAAIALAVAVAAVAGCAGGDGTPSATAKTTVATAAPVGPAELERAVRAALADNFRLSLYVLRNNRLPAWASRSTRGPALTALRDAAVERRRQGIHIRSEAGRYQILRVRLDPSYARAVALVHDRRRVVPYRGDKRHGRAIAVNERARIELRRIAKSKRFVVWRLTPVRR